MNYSIIAHGAAKYGFGAMRVGMFMGGCFISYGFGLVRGERRVYSEIDRNLGLVKRGIELVIDEKRWKQEINKELQRQAAIDANKNNEFDVEKRCAHPH